MRNAKIFVLVGGRATGKTYFLEKNLDASNTIVYELIKTTRYVNFKRDFFENFSNVNWRQISNKSIVIEDATQLVACNMSNKLKQLIVNSKQIGSDIYIIFHSFAVIPPFLFQIFDYIIQFKTSFPIKKACFEEYYEEIIQNFNKLQKNKKFSYKVIESHIN